MIGNPFSPFPLHCIRGKELPFKSLGQNPKDSDFHYANPAGIPSKLRGRKTSYTISIFEVQSAL